MLWQIVGVGTAPENPEFADVLDASGRKGGRDGCGRHPVRTGGDDARRGTGAGSGRPVRVVERPAETRRVLPHRFEECGYRRVLNVDAKDGLWVMGGKRQAVYGRVDVPPAELLKAAGKLA